MGCGFFVTGTDTGVGKTTFAVALIRALRQRGLNVATMKPVAAGCEWMEGRLSHDDVVALSAAANVKADPRLMNPYAFIPPIAPHIAAAQAGVAIEFDKIMAAYTALSAQSDVVVVEGVGGFRVPLGARLDTADMACVLDLPIILVVGVRLGCLNHALLTAEAIAHRGLKWAGWVANILEPNMDALDENIAELEMRLPSPCLGSMSRCHTLMTDPVAAYSMQWLNFPEA
jgi:dethiobiotin synthetase